MCPKKYVCRLFLLAVLLAIVVFPAYSQKSNKIWLGIPIWVSAQIPLSDVNENITSQTDEILRRIDVNLALQLMFPLSASASLGAEAGVSYPPATLIRSAQDRSASSLANIVHIPVRLVANFALTDQISLDAFVGAVFNISDSIEKNASTLVPSIGARLDLFNFIIHAAYTIPYAVNLTSASASQKGAWDNNINLGIGYRIEI